MVWVDIFLSITLPFALFAVLTVAFFRLVQRVPVSPRAIERARQLGPPEPREPAVDAGGNARHEWAVEMEALRLRRNERRW